MTNFIDINDIKKVNQSSVKFGREKKTCNNMNVDIDFLDNNESLRSVSMNNLNDFIHSI
jgi:hypothetical protein